MGKTLRLTLDSTLTDLSILVERVEVFADEHRVDAEIRGLVQLALEEVITNIIKHGYGEAGHAIDVTMEMHDTEIALSVEDEARPFNPLAQAAPNLELPMAERKPGGLGIHLVKKVMDVVEYEWRDGKNRLTMRKAR